MGRRLLVLLPLGASAIAGCTLLTGLDGLRGDGGAIDAAPDVPIWDSAVEAEAAVDAASEADAGPCDRTKPFLPPVAVAGLALDARSEELVRFTPDLLTAWVLTRTPDINGIKPAIQEFTRATTSDAFGAGVDLGIPTNSLGTTGTSGHFGISTDRLRVVFGDAQGKLEDCKRASLVAPWSCAALLVDAAMPFLSPSGKRIYSVAALPLGFLAPATQDFVSAAWTPPTKIAELDVYGNPTKFGHPALTTDEKTIVYEVNDEIWLAHQANGAFANPEKLVGLQAKSSVTHPSWISDDECTLALISDRIASTDVFLAKRPK